MNKYNCVIIGAGNKGALADAPGSGNEHKYLSYAHAVKEHPNFDIAFFSDIEPRAVKKARDIWGSNYEKADVIIICTPDGEHYKYLLDFNVLYNQDKVKLVICEKPLCEDLSQAKEIVELYKSKNIPLMVDYTRRFIPKWQQAKNEIVADKYGKFIKGYCYFNRGREHTASHFIDQVLWYNGNLDNIHIEEVEATYQWVYQWGLFYEKDFVHEHAVNFKTEKVDSIYDNHLMYVLENAYRFLNGEEKLFCTGEDALRALEETYRLENLTK